VLLSGAAKQVTSYGHRARVETRTDNRRHPGTRRVQVDRML
jgi:hypothetical protein